MKNQPRRPDRKRTAVSKRLLIFALALLLAVSCAAAPVASAAGAKLNDFFVTAAAGHGSTAIHWWYHPLQGAYYLFLPAGVDRSALQVGFVSDAASVSVDGKQVKNGEVTDALAGGSSFTVRCGARSYLLRVLQSASLPSLYIATESGTLDNVHADKSHKEPAAISIMEDGALTMEDVPLSYIKGRGNSSWMQDKKPYNIKFEKKTDLFGMGKAKKWTLVSLTDDDALVRNPAAFYIAERLGLDYISQYRFVDLYANGEYLGDYLLCESVEVGSTRVDIEDLEDANEEANPGVDIEACPTANTGAGKDSGSRKWVEIPNSPADVTGGYLMEFDYRDRYDAEVSGFVSSHGQPVVLKSPEYASKAEVDYISTLFNYAEEALYSEDGLSSEGKHYSEYFDMDSFLAQYLLNEFCNDVDASSSSFFLYKSTRDDKLHFSPVWDFDRALGNGYRRDVDTADPTIWWANSMGDFAPGVPSVNAVAFRFHPEFRTAAAEAWSASFLSQQSDALVSYLQTLSSQVRPSAVMDRVRWNPADAVLAGADVDVCVRRVLRFIQKRVDVLNDAFSAPVAMLYYDANGGSGIVFNHQIAHVGDTVRITEGGKSVRVSPPDDSVVFAGWNTRPDGSGKTYRANELICLTAETTVLYAKWEPADGLAGRIKAFLYQLRWLLLELQDWIEYTFKFPVQ